MRHVQEMPGIAPIQLRVLHPYADVIFEWFLVALKYLKSIFELIKEYSNENIFIILK